MDFKGWLTPQGEALLAQTLLGGTLTVTRVMAGCGTTAHDAVDLAEPRQTVTISDRTTDGSLATLMVTLAASLAESPYTLTELGVYARDADGTEILYQVYQLDQPVEISPDSRLVIRCYLRLAASDQLQFTLEVPPSGLLEEADVRDKADLINGQVPYAQTRHLTEDKTLYVDVSAGNDQNPGTASAPFRSIQAAVDSLPKDLGGHRATIILRPGTYDEEVVVSGFYHGFFGGGIQIQGASSLEEAELYRVRAAKVQTNAVACRVEGLSFYGLSSGDTEASVTVTCSSVIFFRVKFMRDAVLGADTALLVWYGMSGVNLTDVLIDGYPKFGVRAADCSIVSIVRSAIQNCGVGLQAGNFTAESNGIFLCSSDVSFSGNTVDASIGLSGSQIFGLEGVI